MIRFALIFAITFLIVMQAHAQERHGWGSGDSGWRGGGHEPWHGGGYRHDDDGALGGFLGGVLGGYLWRQWNQPPEPQVVVVQPQRDEAWCGQRYHSYDPYTHTYLGFDGLRHGCP